MNKFIEAANYYMTELLDMSRNCPKHIVMAETDRLFKAKLMNGIIVQFSTIRNTVMVDFKHDETNYETRNKQEWKTITDVLDLLYCIILQNRAIYTIQFKTAESPEDIIEVSDYFKNECATNPNIPQDIINKLSESSAINRTEYDIIERIFNNDGYKTMGILFNSKNFKVIRSQRADIYEKAIRKNFVNNDFDVTVEGNFFSFNSKTPIR